MPKIAAVAAIAFAAALAVSAPASAQCGADKSTHSVQAPSGSTTTAQTPTSGRRG